MDRMLSMLNEWIKLGTVNRARSVWIEVEKSVIVLRLRDKDTLSGTTKTFDVIFDTKQLDSMNAVDEFVMHRLNTAFDEIAKPKERKSK